MNQRMYYYTSSDTMSKILTGSRMFATNLGYMNDAREYVHGLRTIRKTFQTYLPEDSVERMFPEGLIKEYERRERELTYFSISFCGKGDRLSQWTTYARESGVSIEMNFDVKKDVTFQIESDESEGSKEGIDVSTHPERIRYVKSNGTETQIKAVWKMFDSERSTDEDYLKRRGEKVSAYIKQDGFSQENEYRIVFDSTEMMEPPKIEYWTDKHVLKPYISVECAGGWPVTSVMIGPGFNQEVVSQSVRFFLNHARVNSSKLLTRGQWKDQIEAYFQNGGPELKIIWRELKKDDDPGSFIKEWRNLGENPEEKLEEDSKSIWARKVEKAMKSVIDKDHNKPAAEKYWELVNNHYFTASGIILKKSNIPYIY